MKPVWCVVLLTSFLPATQAVLRAQSTPNAAATDAASSPSANLRRELTEMLIADSQKTPKPDRAPAAMPAPAGPAAIATDPNVSPDQKAPDVVVPPREDRVTRFFRTGTLHYFHEKTVAADLYAGPCSDGQLINLKSSW